MASFMLYKALSLLAKQNKEKRLQRPLKTHSQENCRICLHKDAVIPLFNNNCRPTIAQDIFNFTGVQIKHSKKTSKYICHNCLDLLDGCIKFRKMCRRSNKKIKALKPENKNGTVQEDFIDEAESNELFTSLCDDDNDGHESEYEPYDTAASTMCEDGKKKKLECKYCNEDFKNWEQYNSHLPCEMPEKVNTKVKKKQKKRSSLCDVCGKVFSSLQILIGHRATHSNVFAYKCAKCPYESRHRAYLVIHMRSHMAKNERPYKCALCPSTAATASNLASHVRRVHTNDRPFKCTSCEKSFRCKYDLTNHTRLVHLREMTVECDICYKTFNSKKYLKSHNWKVHKIKPEKSNLPNKVPSYIQHRAKLEQENYANHIESLHASREENVDYTGPLI